MSETAESLLEFWVDGIPPERWYVSDAELDAEIARRFEPLWERARDGGLETWKQEPRSALALLVLLDQFSRNMFRGTPKAFSTDALALRIAKQSIEARHDMAIPEPERQFFYLPLMHAEDSDDQSRCCALIAERMPETGHHNTEHAEKHAEVIARFGRFPSRNAILGRDDTAEERAYREAGGYMG